MVRKSLIIVVILIVGLLFFVSCGKEYQKDTMLDQNWGRSFESAKQNQILYPEAGKNSEPVEGMDGKAADNAIEKYQKSFEREPAQATYDINLGVLGGQK